MPTNQQHEQHHQNLQHHVEHQEEEEIVDYDTILEHTGQMGKFQLRICLLLFFPAFFPGIAVMSYDFTGAIPRYRFHPKINQFIQIFFVKKK